MSRNTFENITPDMSEDDAQLLGGRVHSLLPPLAAGHHYELLKLSSGTAVVIEED